MPFSGRSSSSPFSLLRRSIFRSRKDQVHSMESDTDSDARYSELESFQNQVHDRLSDLSADTADQFLSAAWLQKLLEAFLSCQEDFELILSKNRELITKPPLDRLVSDYFERSVKALDICNATREGIGKIRLWQSHLEIVLAALDSKQRMIGEGQIRRARKALMDLALVMLQERETGCSSGSRSGCRSSSFSRRNRSFGHWKSRNDPNAPPQLSHSRSLSWSVSQSWSASKQLQSFANSLIPPRGNEVVATKGLIVPIFTMNCVVMYVLWALVVSIPCQDRGFPVQFLIPRLYSWSDPLISLRDRVMDMFRMCETRNCGGLLEEVREIENCIYRLTDMVESIEFPVKKEEKEKIERRTRELSAVFEDCKKGLEKLEQQVKEVFQKIMNCRTVGLQLLKKDALPHYREGRT
ncbi:hypothetical protein NMG60_11021506 [Bertholletia excelsa]